MLDISAFAKDNINNSKFSNNYKFEGTLDNAYNFSNYDFFCIQGSRKLISGKRSFQIKIGYFEMNILKFEGFKMQKTYKCIFK